MSEENQSQVYLSEDVAASVAIEEFRTAQQRISEFDKLLITIKSWSITLSGVAIGLGFIDGQRILFLLGGLSALMFWYLEALNKVFQFALIKRAREVEKEIADLSLYSGPKISSHFNRVIGFGETFRALWVMITFSNVQLPHNLIVLAGFVLYFFPDAINLLGVKGAS
ncbi:MAG: hypothetical protein AAGI89_10915 [Pseudomonadota bacterium]